MSTKHKFSVGARAHGRWAVGRLVDRRVPDVRGDRQRASRPWKKRNLHSREFKELHDDVREIGPRREASAGAAMTIQADVRGVAQHFGVDPRCSRPS
jgi:hypothetical protein